MATTSASSGGGSTSKPLSLMQDEKTECNFLWEQLPTKCKQRILEYLDLHKLFECRRLSQSLRKEVDPVIASKVTVELKCGWSPYFTQRKYYHLDNTLIFGMVRLDNAAAVQRFTEEHNPPETPQQEASPSQAAPESPRVQELTFSGLVKKVQSKSSRKPAISDPLEPDPVSETEDKKIPETLSPSHFPLGVLHVIAHGCRDSANLCTWSCILLEKLGTSLTSFTFDMNGQTFPLQYSALKSMLTHLPNLQYLGVSAQNYNNEPVANASPSSPRFPAIPVLRFLWIGHDPNFFLHQDLLTSYGSQLKRISHSKLETSASSSSLKRLLICSNSLRNQHPTVLNALEELKCSATSSENIWQAIQVMAAASPILWSNLRRLSIHYSYSPPSKYSALADLFLFLNIISPTLEEFSMDFESCTGFVQWMTLDSRPLSKDVLRACRRVRKVCISAKSLVRAEELRNVLYAKFPRVKKLTFFQWLAYQNEACQSNFQGETFSRTPANYEDIEKVLLSFWEGLPDLTRISVGNESWKNDCLYSKTREEMELS